MRIIFEKIINLGKMIDEFDIAFENHSFDGINLSTLTIIEENIKEI